LAVPVARELVGVLLLELLFKDIVQKRLSLAVIAVGDEDFVQELFGVLITAVIKVLSGERHFVVAHFVRGPARSPEAAAQIEEEQHDGDE
jgi:hypothetical protein